MEWPLPHPPGLPRRYLNQTGRCRATRLRRRSAKAHSENTVPQNPNPESDNNNREFPLPHPIVTEDTETFVNEPAHHPAETTAAQFLYHPTRNELDPTANQSSPPPHHPIRTRTETPGPALVYPIPLLVVHVISHDASSQPIRYKCQLANNVTRADIFDNRLSPRLIASY